jgi:hypothetical protein
VRLVGFKLAVGFAAAVPVPLKVTSCVLPGVLPELSVNVRVAGREPAAAGVKVTLTIHVPPGAMERLAVQVVPVAAA